MYLLKLNLFCLLLTCTNFGGAYSRFFTKDGVRGYRFGFNGKEKVDEVYGDANAYDFGARLYDPRLGRWLAVDELSGKYPFVSPYNFVLNTPLIAIDPSGEEVYFIIYSEDNTDGKAAAETRQNEILNSGNFDPTKDHIYVIKLIDAGRLEEQVKYCVNDASKNNFGKTVEASFFGHMGSDGPIGTVKTTKNSLGELTGNSVDDNQLSPKGWKRIDFNFDKERSIATFYGCKSSGFAEKFLVYQPDLQYTSGIEGSAGGSSRPSGRFKANEYNLTGKQTVYMVDQEDGDIMSRPVYSQNINLGEGNEYPDKEGNIIPMKKAVAYIVGNSRPELFKKK